MPRRMKPQVKEAPLEEVPEPPEPPVKRPRGRPKGSVGKKPGPKPGWKSRPKLGERRHNKPSKKQAEHLSKVRPVVVKLTMQHGINNTVYGPGEVRVRPDIAQVLIEQEQNAQWSERQMWDTKARMIGVGGNGQVVAVPVPPDDFQTIFANPTGALLIRL